MSGKAAEVERQTRARAAIDKALGRELGPPDRKQLLEEMATRGAFSSTVEGEGDGEAGSKGVAVKEKRAAAREAALQPTLEQWARELRKEVWGVTEPPFQDMASAEPWLELARDAVRGPTVPDGESLGEEDALTLGEALSGLEQLHQHVEESFGVSLPEPIPDATVLEVPRPESSRPEDSRERLQKRIPVIDSHSQHFAVAQAVDEMAEFSGHRSGQLTRLILTGQEPELPDVTLEVRTELGSPTADPEDLYGNLEPERHTVLRLNEPPTVRRMETILRGLRKAWESPGEHERRQLRRLVEKLLSEEEREHARRADWEPVAEAWNQGRGKGDEVGWRTVQMRYKMLSESQR